MPPSPPRLSSKAPGQSSWPAVGSPASVSVPGTQQVPNKVVQRTRSRCLLILRARLLPRPLLASDTGLLGGPLTGLAHPPSPWAESGPHRRCCHRSLLPPWHSARVSTAGWVVWRFLYARLPQQTTQGQPAFLTSCRAGTEVMHCWADGQSKKIQPPGTGEAARGQRPSPGAERGEDASLPAERRDSEKLVSLSPHQTTPVPQPRAELTELRALGHSECSHRPPGAGPAQQGGSRAGPSGSQPCRRGTRPTGTVRGQEGSSLGHVGAEL